MLKKRNEKFWNTKHPGIETKVSEMKKKKKKSKTNKQKHYVINGKLDIVASRGS